MGISNVLAFTSQAGFSFVQKGEHSYKAVPALPVTTKRVVPKRARFPIVCSSIAVHKNDVSTPLDLPNPNSSLAAKEVSASRAVSRFLRLLWSHWRLFVPALAAASLASICSVCQPVLYGRILGVLARAHSMPFEVGKKELYGKVATIVKFYILEMAATVCFVTLTTKVVDRATRELREDVFTKVWRNDIGFFDNTGRSEIERNLADEIKTVRVSVWNNLSRDRGIRAFLDVILGLVIAFRTTGVLGAPIFGVLVPIIALFVARMGMRNGRIATEMSLKDSNVQRYLNEKIRGVRTVKAFGAERREERTLSNLLDKSQDQANKFGASQAWLEAANRLSIYLTITALFLLGGVFICSGRLTFETFTCMTGFIWILNFAMQGVSYTITDVSRMVSSLKSIYRLHDEAVRYTSNTSTSAILPNTRSRLFAGNVQFRDVGFQYPSKPDVPVLTGINFSIRPGQVIALVGNSGGGKSTIAAMLCRFYAPTTGLVTLDDIDTRMIPQHEFARNISVVDQDPVLFQASIRENIAYGLPDEQLSDDTIIQAAKDANAHEFIMKLKDGYDSVWTPASNLSGGQKQRIAIARSLVKSPHILVLDEATSALDQESERTVQEALEKIMKNRSVLIIAHRLSTVRAADAILFVKEGQIVERGTYDELIARPNGHFKTLIEAAADIKKRTTQTI